MTGNNVLRHARIHQHRFQGPRACARDTRKALGLKSPSGIQIECSNRLAMLILQYCPIFVVGNDVLALIKGERVLRHKDVAKGYGLGVSGTDAAHCKAIGLVLRDETRSDVSCRSAADRMRARGDNGELMTLIVDHCGSNDPEAAAVDARCHRLGFAVDHILERSHFHIIGCQNKNVGIRQGGASNTCEMLVFVTASVGRRVREAQ